MAPKVGPRNSEVLKRCPKIVGLLGILANSGWENEELEVWRRQVPKALTKLEVKFMELVPIEQAIVSAAMRAIDELLAEDYETTQSLDRLRQRAAVYRACKKILRAPSAASFRVFDQIYLLVDRSLSIHRRLPVEYR